jgi:Arc/MetJ-type ribon-helix-helix transcriptional regulator
MGRMESDESNTQRVTVRVPQDLLDEYDDVLDGQDKNRSEAIRQHMRETVSQPTTDGGLVPPEDDDTLAAAYQELQRLTTDGRSIPLTEARSVLASKLNLPKESVPRRILKPLTERGYLKRCGDPVNQPHLEVR